MPGKSTQSARKLKAVSDDALARRQKLNRLRRNPVRTRLAFRAGSQEASCHVIRYKGKLRFFRVPSYLPLTMGESQVRIQKQRAQMHFITASIFYSLFPKHSIKPVGVTCEQALPATAGKSWGLVSEILRGRSPGYKKINAEAYRTVSRPVMDPDIRAHYQFVKEIGGPLAERIEKETGIELGTHPVNVAEVQGQPVFVEITDINAKKATQYIESLSRPEKEKKELLALIDRFVKARSELGSSYMPQR